MFMILIHRLAGIARLHTYFELLQVGRINPKPVLKIVRETGLCLFIITLS